MGFWGLSGAKKSAYNSTWVVFYFEFASRTAGASTGFRLAGQEEADQNGLCLASALSLTPLRCAGVVGHCPWSLPSSSSSSSLLFTSAATLSATDASAAKLGIKQARQDHLRRVESVCVSICKSIYLLSLITSALIPLSYKLQYRLPNSHISAFLSPPIPHKSAFRAAASPPRALQKWIKYLLPRTRPLSPSRSPSMLVVTPTERPHRSLLAPVLYVPASRTR